MEARHAVPAGDEHAKYELQCTVGVARNASAEKEIMPETLWAAIEAVLAPYFDAFFARMITHHWSRCGGGIVCFVAGQD